MENETKEEGEAMAGEEREYPHWRRVYLIVIIYTVAIISALWLFSRAYS